MNEDKINPQKYLKHLNLKKEKRINSKNGKEYGFTLVELLAAIAIVAILGLIAVPNILNTLNNSKDAAYNMMIKNIKVAAQELYEEIDFAESELYDYDNNGEKIEQIRIDNNSITVTLQGLVNNGFLSGTNNSLESSDNKNSKIILEPKDKKDIGYCSITITKRKQNSKVCYEVTDNSNNNICPQTKEYGTCF